jgi:hypothetical protein
MVQYVEPSVTSRVWPGCIVIVLPFWLSPAWISLEGELCPCHGSAQLARHMQKTQHAAITIARGQKALMNIPLFIPRISLVSPSYRPHIALISPAKRAGPYLLVHVPPCVPDRRSWLGTSSSAPACWRNLAIHGGIGAYVFFGGLAVAVAERRARRGFAGVAGGGSSGGSSLGISSSARADAGLRVARST